MTSRRDAIAAGAAAVFGPMAFGQAASVRRIGYLGYTAATPPGDERIWLAFVQRLRELGFVEGANLTIESRYAEGHNERYVELAAELVRLRSEVIVVSNGSAARAVMGASRNTAIVTIAVPDPVRAGLVASLARPGGRVTGISNLSEDLVPKRIELLKMAVPGARRIAFARCPRCAQTAGESQAQVAALLGEHVATARTLGATLQPLDVNDVADFDAACAAALREHADALLIGATQINVALRDQWLAFAAAHKLPMLAPYRSFGALLSYGPDIAALYRHAADFVARILNGADPAEIPMEQPTTFELVVNLRIARSIGLTISQSLLLRADEVIQ